MAAGAGAGGDTCVTTTKICTMMLSRPEEAREFVRVSDVRACDTFALICTGTMMTNNTSTLVVVCSMRRIVTPGDGAGDGAGVAEGVVVDELLDKSMTPVILTVEGWTPAAAATAALNCVSISAVNCALDTPVSVTEYDSSTADELEGGV